MACPTGPMAAQCEVLVHTRASMAKARDAAHAQIAVRRSGMLYGLLELASASDGEVGLG
jgi:hypothetical protein